MALLSGGSDKPYALGLASALSEQGVEIDFIGSDELNCPEVHAIPNLRFLNLRGDQRTDAGLLSKCTRIVLYYGRLLRYAATAGPPTLHILWNNRFELFDRTVLMAYYRLVGKRVVLTAHNVNKAARDHSDSRINRWSLRIQYQFCDHVFVHTEAMKAELVSAFDVPADRVSVIPFGLNDTIPKSNLTRAAARQKLGIGRIERTVLFFGQIAPYKGLEHLVAAVSLLAERGNEIRLIVAGKVKRGSEGYWRDIRRSIADLGVGHLVLERIQFIPDDEVENYFKAADAVVIPYLDIYQSGVPFLAFSFGLPVIATDVGSLREDVTTETGFLSKPGDAADLARAITDFYQSELRRDDDRLRARIRSLAEERHSWTTVGERTRVVYAGLGQGCRRPEAAASIGPHQQQSPSKCQE